MPRSADWQAVADSMRRHFAEEWRAKISAAIGFPPGVAVSQVALLLSEAYICGVRDGEGFGLRVLAQEARRGVLETETGDGDE